MTSLGHWIRERRRAAAASRRARSRDAGDTLIELLVAISIIGIAAAGLLGGLAAAIGGSGTHRSLASLDAVVKSFAETAKYDLQQRPATQGGPMYSACAPSPASYILASAPYPSSGPVGTAVTVFGSGFPGTGTPSATLSPGGPVTNVTGQVTNGNLTSTFDVPELPAGPQTITVGFGAKNAPAAAQFVVTPIAQLDHASGPVGTLVNVSITGFAAGKPLTVKFGTTTIPSGSTNALGSASVSFNVPSSYGTGPQTVSVSDGTGNQSGTTFTVTGNGSTAGDPSSNGPVAVSPLQDYQIGISGIQYWVGSGFTSNQAACGSDRSRSDHLQQLTVTGTAPGANDQLNFVVADPDYQMPPTSLALSVSPNPATTGNTVIFTATVSPTGVPAPTGTITWTVNGSGSTCSPSTLVARTATCMINNAGSVISDASYFVVATYGGDANYTGTSGSISTTVFHPTQLVFTTDPSGGPDGTAWATQPTVKVEDANGDVATSNSAQVALNITSQPAGPTATLSCNGGAATMNAVSGAASFSGCQIVGPAGNYTLTASSPTLPGLTPDTSTFGITVGQPDHLVFNAQPGGGADGAVWNSQPAVTIKDSGGNTVTSSSAPIALSIASQPAGPTATLTCNGGTTSMAATNGIATFSGCQIVGPVGTYTLSASSSSLTSGPSNPFTITVGAASKLAFTTQPGGGQNGAPWATSPTVTVEDSGGNTITSSSARINLSFASQPAGPAATLSCNGGAATMNAVNGVASFSNCQIVGPAGSSYALRASSSGLTNGTSAPFSITVGAATQLVFTTQPAGGANAAAWGTQPTVKIEDSGGNLVISSAPITLSIASQPAGPAATLSCTPNPKPASGGVATFTGCQIIGPAGSYTLTATASGPISGTSASFNITVGAAAQLVFTAQPGGGPNNTVWTNQPTVIIEDSGGNLVSGSVTLSILNEPNNANATLNCTGGLTMTAPTGVASFSGCNINSDKLGTFNLNATSSGLTAASSNFQIR